MARSSGGRTGSISSNAHCASKHGIHSFAIKEHDNHGSIHRSLRQGRLYLSHLRGRARGQAARRGGRGAGNLRREFAHPLGGRRLCGRRLSGGRAVDLSPRQARRRAGLQRGGHEGGLRPQDRGRGASRARRAAGHRGGHRLCVQGRQGGHRRLLLGRPAGLARRESAAGPCRCCAVLRRRHDHAGRNRAPAQGAGAGALRQPGPLDPAGHHRDLQEGASGSGSACLRIGPRLQLRPARFVQRRGGQAGTLAFFAKHVG